MLVSGRESILDGIFRICRVSQEPQTPLVKHRQVPDAPIAHEGFFSTHFFTVCDRTDRWTSMSEIPGGKLTSQTIPVTSTWRIRGDARQLRPASAVRRH